MVVYKGERVVPVSAGVAGTRGAYKGEWADVVDSMEGLDFLVKIAC